MANNKTYTYLDLANDIIAMLNGEAVNTPTDIMVAKAQALADAQVKKAEYAIAHPSKSKAKGASTATTDLAHRIEAVLTAEAMTGSEIAEAIGEPDLSPLRVSNAIKYIEKPIERCKVVRKTTNKSGLTAEKEYTAYKLA